MSASRAASSSRTLKPARPMTALPGFTQNRINQREFSSKIRADKDIGAKRLELRTAKPALLNYNCKSPEGADDDLDLIYLIMKNSPQKYDLDKMNSKFKTLNEFYSHKLIEQNKMNKVDSTFYKYNLLYGSNSTNLIRSYSPKMRPESGAIRQIVSSATESPDYNSFTEDNIRMLFLAKCVDLNIKAKKNLETKFQEYCNKKCINRNVDFCECNLALNTSKVLSFIISTSDKIARLNLSRNSLGDVGIEHLMAGIEKNKSIVYLDISSNDLTAKGGNIVFQSMINNQSIIYLNISSREGLNRNRLTYEGVFHLETVLKSNRFLEFINLSGNSIKNEGLNIVLRGLNENKHVHTLNISNNEIDSIGVAYFPKLVSSCKLNSLILNDNPLGNEGITSIAECLNKPAFSTLKRLEVSNCKFDFFGFRKMFENLQGNKRLEILNCNKNNLKTKGEFDTIKPAFSSLHLKELYLCTCKLGNKAARTLAEGLLTNNTIQKLVIPDNNIDDKGFNYFTEVPLKNNCLQILDVSKNQISDFSANPFVKNLVKNKHIIELNFFDNQLKNETGTSLIEVLRVNTNIQKLNLKFNGIQVRSLEEINRQVKSNCETFNFKKIPNLRKEIRSTYVTDQDFEVIDIKIKETAINYQNLSEKLNNEIERFELLKREEESKIEEMNVMHNESLVKCKEVEERTKIIKKELLIENQNFAKLHEEKLQEITEITEEIEDLNNIYRDLKKEMDKKSMMWKEDIKKMTTENLSSYNNLKSTQKGYESLKKDLDAKILLIKTTEELNPVKEQDKLAVSRGDSKKKSVFAPKERQSTLQIKGAPVTDSQLAGDIKSLGKMKGSVKDLAQREEVATDSAEAEVVDKKSKDVKRAKSSTKPKISTKPKSELKKREKYDLKKPNV